jgi:hypothetical protein
MKSSLLSVVLASVIFAFAQAQTANLLKTDNNLDGTVNNLDLAQLSLEWLNSGLPYAPVTRPFPGPAELKCEQVQRIQVDPNEWKTIIDVNDGPALVTNLWLACDFSSKQRITPLRIYFDDHNSADIEGETGEIFGSGFTKPGNFRGTFIGVTNSKATVSEPGTYYGFSGYLRLPMPYYQSIRVAIQNTSTSQGQCWMMLERLPIDPNRLYCIGLEPGMYLKTYGYGLAGNKTQHSEVTLFDSNGPTIIAGIFHFFNNSTYVGGGGNQNYLEGDYRIYYGGSIVASYQSSGTEDFYHSSWYFQEELFEYMDECLVVNENYITAASRFFPPERAPACANGIKFTWQVGEPGFTTGNTYIRWIVWYYQ